MLLRKNVLKWEIKLQIRFEKVKQLLLSESILKYSNFGKEFLLTIDANNDEISAIVVKRNRHDIFVI